MIIIEDVYKSFGAQQVLKGISLEVKAGETIAVVGPSGVGKSVLLKLIMGIMTPDRGRIIINGQCISEAESEAEKNEIRASVGMLFQAAALFDSLSVVENVAFPLKVRGVMPTAKIYEKCGELLEALSLTRYAHNLPQEISIGMRKRVGIARALATDPKIFLFDEPNTGLDPLDGQEVYDLIKFCKQKLKFAGLVISHEIPEVFQVSDKVAMLLGGKIVALGTPDELKQQSQPEVLQFLEGRTNGPIQIN